ncbi:MAG: class I SAM-dependent methyltransferase, partial [Acidobacteriota bacterium]|nr:class I SAM-dependent methyltransferase [Acidobacteriota bacterium]
RDREVYELPGVCTVDSAVVGFVVDRLCGAAQDGDGLWLPNWRERLQCPLCGLNCRQRLLATMAFEAMEEGGGEPKSLYVMEQVTPMFAVLAARFGDRCVGSEFRGPDAAPGSVHGGLRHENAEDLSFADSTLDVVASNDVLEHVHDPRAAVAEVGRVLRPGGVFLFSIPFYPTLDHTRRRAEVVRGELLHYEPAEYHGDPMSSMGSLVFNDFGWGFIDEFRRLGFSECRASLTWSPAFGFLGAGTFVFRAVARSG